MIRAVENVLHETPGKEALPVNIDGAIAGLHAFAVAGDLGVLKDMSSKTIMLGVIDCGTEDVETVEDGETALICRLVDGSTGTVPARWTDLPVRVAAPEPLGVLATPAGWRLFGERLRGLTRRRPSLGGASVENGGGDVRAARVAGERAGTDGAGGGVGDAAAGGPARGDGPARATAGAVGGGRAR